MAFRPTLLLDAGGTLVYPNAERLADASRVRGLEVDPNAFFASFFRGIHGVDVALREGQPLQRPEAFVRELVVRAGVPEPLAGDVLSDAIRACAPESLWTCLLPGALRAVERLSGAGHPLSVVSNADGTVQQQMDHLGLSPFMDRVFDSHHLGVSKPDPRIFLKVLAELGREPGECLFVGDVVMVDVRGAQAVGIPAVHLDPLGLYAGWPGMRVRDVEHLADALLSGDLDHRDPRLMTS